MVFRSMEAVSILKPSLVEQIQSLTQQLEKAQAAAKEKENHEDADMDGGEPGETDPLKWSCPGCIAANVPKANKKVSCVFLKASSRTPVGRPRQKLARRSYRAQRL